MCRRFSSNRWSPPSTCWVWWAPVITSTRTSWNTIPDLTKDKSGQCQKYETQLLLVEMNNNLVWLNVAKTASYCQYSHSDSWHVQGENCPERDRSADQTVKSSPDSEVGSPSRRTGAASCVQTCSHILHPPGQTGPQPLASQQQCEHIYISKHFLLTLLFFFCLFFLLVNELKENLDMFYDINYMI